MGLECFVTILVNMSRPDTYSTIWTRILDLSELADSPLAPRVEGQYRERQSSSGDHEGRLGHSWTSPLSSLTEGDIGTRDELLQQQILRLSSSYL